MKTPFVWLGSKRAEKRGVGPLGAWLDVAARAGLPVANGAVLLHEFYQLLLESGLIYWQNGRFHADDPQEIHDALYTAVRFPKINKPVTLRPVFGFLINQPTNFKCAQFTNASQLTDILCAVWQVAGSPSTNVRRDIIIQETITPKYLGIAISKSTEQIDQTTYTQTDATQTILATDADLSLQMSQLTRWQTADKNLPAFAQRLQKLLRGVRRTFGDGSWQIEWVDNGRICWLTKIVNTK